MKTVRWKKYAETYYLPMQEDNLTTMPEGNYSGTYVLASEANERIKVLEDALRVAADFKCEWHDCRRWTFKVSDEYCYLHKAVMEALEVKSE